MANFGFVVMNPGDILRLNCDLPVAELLHQTLLSANTDYMDDEEFVLFTEFKSKLLDAIREMK